MIGEGQATVSTIRNSFLAGTVAIFSKHDYVGGLIGYGNVTIKKSYVSNTVTITGQSYVGGFAGNSLNGSSIHDSYFSGTATGATEVGGLIGWGRSGHTIQNSFSTGNVAGTDNVGGLVGSYSGSAITKSYAIGKVTRKNGSATKFGSLFGESTSITTAAYYTRGKIDWNGSTMDGNGSAPSGWSGPGLNATPPLIIPPITQNKFINFDFSTKWSLPPKIQGSDPWPVLTALPTPDTIAEPKVCGKLAYDLYTFVCNESDLHAIGTSANASKNYRLLKNIDLNGKTFSTSIINYTFTGTFNGNDKVISNATINTTSQSTGFFS